MIPSYIQPCVLQPAGLIAQRASSQTLQRETETETETAAKPLIRDAATSLPAPTKKKKVPSNKHLIKKTKRF